MAKTARKVVSLNDGTVYASVSDAANDVGCSKSAIYNSIRYGTPSKGTLWDWADDDDAVTSEECDEHCSRKPCEDVMTTLGVCRPLYVEPTCAAEVKADLSSEDGLDLFEWYFGCSLDFTAFKTAVSASRDNPQHMDEVLLPFDTLLKVTPEYDSFMVLWFMSAGARGFLRSAKDMDEVISRVLEQDREIRFVGLMGDSLFISADSSVPYGSRNFYIRLMTKEDARKLDDIISKNEDEEWLDKRDSAKVLKIWEKKSVGFVLDEDGGRWFIRAKAAL